MEGIRKASAISTQHTQPNLIFGFVFLKDLWSYRKRSPTPPLEYSLYKHSKTVGKHYEKAGENTKVLEFVKEVDSASKTFIVWLLRLDFDFKQTAAYVFDFRV